MTAFNWILALVSLLQLPLLLEVSPGKIVLAVLFQIAPATLGWAFGTLARILTGPLFAKASGNKSGLPILGSVLFYAISIYMIGVFFFVIFNGGGIKDIAEDPLPLGYLLPHPTFLFLGIIHGLRRDFHKTRKVA